MCSSVHRVLHCIHTSSGIQTTFTVGIKRPLTHAYFSRMSPAAFLFGTMLVAVVHAGGSTVCINTGHACKGPRGTFVELHCPGSTSLEGSFSKTKVCVVKWSGGS